MKKCICEKYAVCTQHDRIMVSVFEDGTLEKVFEDHLIREGVIERTNYSNRDRNGNRYTTKNVIYFSSVGWKNWIEDYDLHTIPLKEQRLKCKASHLLYLARCEEEMRNETYKNISDIFRENSINRINQYISNRTEDEKRMPEYRIFINSMEKSLAVLSNQYG